MSPPTAAADVDPIPFDDPAPNVPADRHAYVTPYPGDQVELRLSSRLVEMYESAPAHVHAAPAVVANARGLMRNGEPTVQVTVAADEAVFFGPHPDGRLLPFTVPERQFVVTCPALTGSVTERILVAAYDLALEHTPHPPLARDFTRAVRRSQEELLADGHLLAAEVIDAVAHANRVELVPARGGQLVTA